MTDLSHWDFAERFSGYEAAALILGIEPRDSQNEEHRIRVVMERLELDYSYAIQQAQNETIPFSDNEYYKVNRPATLLVSVEMERLWRRHSDGSETPFDDWLVDKRRHQFDNQMFDRSVIARWLNYVGQRAVYEFDRIPATKSAMSENDTDIERALGSRERNTLLSIIGILCREAKLDYLKHAKTAGLLKDTAASMGVSIGESTIELHLKKVPTAIAALTR